MGLDFFSRIIGKVCEIFSIPHVRARCGHRTRTEGEIVVGGKKFRFKLIPVNEGIFEYCENCLKKSVISCAWCGKLIFPGEEITLINLSEILFLKKYGKTLGGITFGDLEKRGANLPGNNRVDDLVALGNAVYFASLVGCTEPSCCDSKNLVEGTWEYPGKVVLKSKRKAS